MSVTVTEPVPDKPLNSTVPATSRLVAFTEVNEPAAVEEPPMTVPSIVPPSMSGVFTSGDVRVLLVSVCEPVRVATVESMLKVTSLPEPAVSTPVPPVSNKVSESRSMLNAPPVSAWKSRSCAVTCEST